MENQEHDLYDLGLAADLAMLKRSPIDRRRILKLGVIGIGMLLTGCGDAVFAQTGATPVAYFPLILKPDGPTPTSTTEPTTEPTTTPTATPTTTPTECVSEIPQETAGPYPADGSNASNQTLNVLTRSGIVRSDIRTSLGTANTAQGLPSPSN